MVGGELKVRGLGGRLFIVMLRLSCWPNSLAISGPSKRQVKILISTQMAYRVTHSTAEVEYDKKVIRERQKQGWGRNKEWGVKRSWVLGSQMGGGGEVGTTTSDPYIRTQLVSRKKHAHSGCSVHYWLLIRTTF